MACSMLARSLTARCGTEQVLRGITRVYAAKRAAALRAIEEESKDTGSGQQLLLRAKAHAQQLKRHKRKEAAAAAS